MWVGSGVGLVLFSESEVNVAVQGLVVAFLSADARNGVYWWAPLIAVGAVHHGES
jgi:hypothetical protein